MSLIKLLTTYPEKPWSLYSLSMNPNITPEFVLAHPEKPWYWDCLSENPSITPEFILSHPEIDWDWSCLSMNPVITPEFILAHPEKPWNYYWLSMNPNITSEFIISHPNKPWNWYELSNNEFKYDKCLQKLHINKLKQIRTRVKSFRIKNWYGLYLLIRDPSQCFWKWYCGEGGVGRMVDIARAGCID